MAVVLGALFLLSSVAIAHELILFPNKVAKKTAVTVIGLGLTAGQEVGLRMMMGGVLSDVSFLAKPAIEKVDAKGRVMASWGVNRELRLLANGDHEIMLVDSDGNTIATTMLTVAKPPKKKK
ncbi:hypothetical protein GBAR_LOCUS24493 [Geodia barretti]|uniref:Uncharacterized protein n=1 Tax=Geodia barretti TaxID=519541 RepID=A0AA35TA06_GEOBA|nr:hypothetical protein GBAR_LOCUS24493 [Geodia barretti]